MLLKWLPNNQLKTDCTEMYTQYSQLVSQLYVLSDVFNPSKAALTAQFGRINSATQSFEPTGDPVLMNGYQGDPKDITKGFMYECFLPTELLTVSGVAGVTMTAQVDTGTVNSDGKKIYQVFTSGIYAFYVEPSLESGIVPIPDEIQDLINRISQVEDKFVELEGKAIMSDKISVEAETLPPGSEAAASVNKQPDGMTIFNFGIPSGQNGASIESITSGTPEITEEKTITPVTVETTDNTSAQFNVEAQNGKNGNGVFGASIENGDLIIYIQNVEGADFGIREDGYLTVNLTAIN